VAAALERVRDVVDGLLSIPDGEAGWLVPAVIKGARELRHQRPDVIYSSAPPWTGQVVAYVLRLLLRAPWVADFRDPWARAPWRGDRMRVALRAATFLERVVVGKADHILFAARGNRDEFASHYGPAAAARFHFITNGCDPEEFRQLPPPTLPPDGRFVLLHAGSLYAGRTPTSVLRAASMAVRRGLIDRQRLTIRFLGSVGLRDVDLAGLCRELDLEGNVEFVPSVPRAVSLAAMTSASALLILQPGHTVSVPGKLFEYLAAGRPILAVAEEGEIADLVRASGIGVSVRPDDDEGLISAFGQLVTLARGDVPRPSETLFDGTASAARAVGILEAVVRGDRVPAATRSEPETTVRLS
jgi:glycosyltransferase involved in cell wall biosynthesis